jgi:GNAT superfamily N-acetyltransferase
MGRTRNAVYPQGYRGFESHPLRQEISYMNADLKFEPLSQERLEQALLLVKKCFPDEYESAEVAYKESLGTDHYNSLWTTYLQYWVVIDKDTDKIVALTGLYQDFEQAGDEVWLGWFCVDPDQRRRGLGRETLKWTIDFAKSQGYKYLRLWTSDHPDEAPAQALFESMGLKAFRQKHDAARGYNVVHRQLKL